MQYNSFTNSTNHPYALMQHTPISWAWSGYGIKLCTFSQKSCINYKIHSFVLPSPGQLNAAKNYIHNFPKSISNGIWYKKTPFLNVIKAYGPRAIILILIFYAQKYRKFFYCEKSWCMYVTYQTSGIRFKPSLKEEKAVKQTSNSDQKCICMQRGGLNKTKKVRLCLQNN